MRPVAVVGTGQTKHAQRRIDVSLPEMVREAATAAMQDAGVKPAEIDAVVMGSGPEIFEGVNFPDHWLGPAMAVAGKPVIRVETGGTAGSTTGIAAFHYVASGVFDLVLAIGYEKLSDGDTLAGMSRVYDPRWDRDFAPGAPGLAGLQARQYLDRHAHVTEQHGGMVVVKNRRNGTLNSHAQVRREVTLEEVMSSRPVAEPIKLLDCAPSSDGAAAMVLSSERRARKLCANPAWFVGMGSCSESTYAPHMDIAYPESCVRAAQQAYQMAWIYDPPTELDLAEVFEAFSFQELVWCEALGLCRPGEAGRLIESGATGIEGSIPVNPSGGALCANPIGACGLIRQVEAATQVMGRAGDHQVPGAKRALAHAWGGAIQFNSVTIFSSEL